MNTALKVLVLGGRGFIGRHVVTALAARGCQVTLGSRYPRRCSRYPQPCVEVRFEDRLDPANWAPLLAGHEVVVNCVGILRNRRRETYDKIHHRAPAALAAACAACGIRLIHVSALGLEDPTLRSGFLRSKRDGEAAVRAGGGDWHIVRPSLLDGEGGYGARWIRRVARWPVHPMPRGATGRIAVLDVHDLGEAITALALSEHPDRREHDLGGLHALTLAEYLVATRALHTTRPARQWLLPDTLTRLVAHICDVLHITPFSFGHWELLQRDNCPHDNRLPALLGRAPKTIGAKPTVRPMQPVPATLTAPEGVA